MDQAGEPPPCFVHVSGGFFEEYMGFGPGVRLGHGQTEAEGVTSQDERGDALLRRIPPDLS